MSFSISDFQATDGETRGQTPSFQAKRKDGVGDDSRYQIKRSNNIVRSRRWFGYDPDQSDILGEFIASRVIAKCLNTDPGKPELAPQVDLVANTAQKDFSLASRYLNDTERETYTGMTLLELTELNDEHETRDRKSNKLVIGKAGDNQLSITDQIKVKVGGKVTGNSVIGGEEMTLTMDKTELYDSLASSLVLGDHDVNPGNFYGIIDKENSKLYVGRIDMGHAFNDLIKSQAPWSQAPNILHGRKNLLDSLNRTTDNSGTAKLSRHFDDDILLDPEFAESLRKQEVNIRGELDQCKQDLVDLIKTDRNVREAVVKSAITLCKRQGKPLTKEELKVKTWGQWFKDLFRSKANIEKDEIARSEAILGTVIDRTAKFIEENQKEAKSVANVIDVQAKVKKMVELSLEKDISPEELKNMRNEIEAIYAKDEMYLKGKSFEDPIEWVRTSDHSTPDGEKASLDEYIKRIGEHYYKEAGLDYHSSELSQGLEEILDNSKDLRKSKSKDKHRGLAAEPNLSQEFSINRESSGSTLSSLTSESSLSTAESLSAEPKELDHEAHIMEEAISDSMDRSSEISGEHDAKISQNAATQGTRPSSKNLPIKAAAKKQTGLKGWGTDRIFEEELSPIAVAKPTDARRSTSSKRTAQAHRKQQHWQKRVKQEESSYQGSSRGG